MQLINGSDSEETILVFATKEDFSRLEVEIDNLPKNLAHSDVFFKFANYPDIISLVNVKKAKDLLANGQHFYECYPKEKYWLSLTKLKDGAKNKSL